MAQIPLPARAASGTIYAVSLDGPSRRIISEPVELPAVEQVELPQENEPCPDPREPAHAPELAGHS